MNSTVGVTRFFDPHMIKNVCYLRLTNRFISSLFYFGKNHTFVIEIILLQCLYSIKSKLATALAKSIYTEGPFGL